MMSVVPAAARTTVLAASLPVTEPATEAVAPARSTDRTEAAVPVMATSLRAVLANVTVPVEREPDALPVAFTLNFSTPSAVIVLPEVVEAPLKLTVISSAVPIVAAAPIVTVVSALEAITLTSGITVKPLTITAFSEPLLVTPERPDIKDASTVVAVTAFTERFSIEEVVTPAPNAEVADVLDSVSVSVPSPPLRLSPALSVETVAPETVAAVAANESLPAAPVDVSRPVVSELTLYPDNPLI
jgi:hypothetical protein